MIKVLLGNIFDSKCKTIVNTVNCVGVMGKGIALEFKKRYYDMFLDYKFKCDREEVVVGKPYFYNDSSGKQILNFPTKNHWRGKSELSYITEGLDWFINNYKENNVESIAFTALGCGNGGLSWDVIGKVMYQKLYELPIEIEIYAPIGTEDAKLSEEFLSSGIDYDQLIVKKMKKKFELEYNEKWEMIPVLLKEMKNYNPSLVVGKTVFKDISFILNYYYPNLNIHFSMTKYGVYSNKINDVKELLIKKRLITEEKNMRLSEIKVSDEVELDKDRYNENEIEALIKTVKFFMGVRSASEASLKTSILYAYQTIKKEKQIVTKEEVYNFLKNKKMDFKDEVFNSIYIGF